MNLFGKRKGVGGLVIVLIVIAIAATVLIKSGILSLKVTPTQTAQQPSQLETPLNTQGPTPTPTMTPLPQGLQEYTVGQGAAAKGPYVSKIILDPHDPKINDSMRVRVTSSKRNAQISKVIVTEKNDTGSVDHPLTLVSGTADNGEWEAKWNITNTHNYTFSIITTSFGTDGTQTVVDMVFRKP